MTLHLNITNLLNEAQTLTNAYDIVDKAKGERFNLFSILGMESDEVSTHSRFLAELLNKNGSHGQKDIFLKLFIKHLKISDLKFNTENSKTIIEYHVGKVTESEGGRIDILIKDLDGNVIMIENKIYAAEQPNQLLRYKNTFKNGYLIYLTLNGDNSSESNIKVEYKTLSYKNDIVRWLEECKKEAVEMPILRETIQQYINLIKKLTGQNINTKMSEEILKLLLRDSDKLMAYSALIQVNNKLRKYIISEISAKIKIIVKNKFDYDIMTEEFIGDKGCLFYLQNKKLKDYGVNIRFNFERSPFSSLIFGFANDDKAKPKDELLLTSAKKHFPNAKQSDWWSVYIPFENYSNWNYETLCKIYFGADNNFFDEVEDKVQKLISIFEHRTYLSK
jgi:hypothetical protein